jgi:hypothetical protein
MSNNNMVFERMIIKRIIKAYRDNVDYSVSTTDNRKEKTLQVFFERDGESPELIFSVRGRYRNSEVKKLVKDADQYFIGWQEVDRIENAF